MRKLYCDRCGKDISEGGMLPDNLETYPDGCYEVIVRKPCKDDDGKTMNLDYSELDLCSGCRKDLTDCLEKTFLKKPFLISKKWNGPYEEACC